jgi:predicted ATPase
LVEAGKAEDAIQKVSAAIEAERSTGSTVWMPWHLSYLARAYASLGQFDSAWRCLGDALMAVDSTKERWSEAEIYRVGGEIALLGPAPDPHNAEEHFEQALVIARAQQAKSWELRAATSLARLWRDQGQRQEAYDCLAPVYGWFTEGFDTLDLREARALLDSLTSGGDEVFVGMARPALGTGRGARAASDGGRSRS